MRERGKIQQFGFVFAYGNEENKAIGVWKHILRTNHDTERLCQAYWIQYFEGLK